MELEDLEKTLKPLLINWKEFDSESDFGDFIKDQDESYILNLLNEIQ